jgi:hypothetical protein
MIQQNNDPFMDQWKAYTPTERFTTEQLTDASIPSEIRKLMAVADLQSDLPNMEFPIYNQEDSQTYKDMNELAGGYYKAKWDHYVDQTLSKLKITSKDHDREWAIEHDEDMKERVEIMYSFDDIAHDRHVLRDRFLKEMNKKTTLKDIGRKLDEFILDAKANNAQFY